MSLSESVLELKLRMFEVKLGPLEVACYERETESEGEGAMVGNRSRGSDNVTVFPSWFHDAL